MALQDVFLAPLGLAALLAAVPIVILYLIRPDPSRVELPTFRFLADEQRQRATSPVLERLSRSLLLLVQLVAVVLLATSLASPYVPVSEEEVVEETILVVDTSASMATTADGASRFDEAVAAAREEVSETTSVVTTGGGGAVVLRRGPPSDARAALDSLAVTDAPGDLRGAIAQARSLAGEDVRVVVMSDFAGDAWTDPVAATRARGLRVDLRQFDRGGGANVGIVDRRFSQSEVTLSVRNFGEDAASRTVALGDQQTTVDLGPGDTGTVTFTVPAGGARATLSPGDGFATDDSVAIAAPTDPTVDVLVLTNDRNRFLVTALEVLDQVAVTVDNPPTTVGDDHDVIVYSNVDGESLLPGNVAAGRDLVADGGGIAVQAQSSMPDRLRELSLLSPTGVETAPTIRRTVPGELTRDIDFQPPEAYRTGSLTDGRTLVELQDGTPLLAAAERNGGRVLYYGYLEDRSSFKYHYQYPVFWKRAVFHLAGRKPLSELNHATGDAAAFDASRVQGPDGRVVRGESGGSAGSTGGPGDSGDGSGESTGSGGSDGGAGASTTVALSRAGFYATDDRRQAAALLDEAESAVGVDPLTERSDETGTVTRVQERTVPRPLTEYAAIAALLVVVLEVAYVRRRGDL